MIKCLNSFILNSKQIALLKELKTLAKEVNKSNSLFQFFNKHHLKNGIYLYGPVGSGKTLLMKSFFEVINISKTILHYQNFIHAIHKSMHKLQTEKQKDIIPKIAKNYAKQTKVLCIDEFEIKDITDAMIISRLFNELIKQNIFIFITSNTLPNNLYKDGLQRESFLPFIKIINNTFYIKYLDNQHDYRFDNKALGAKCSRIIYPLTLENKNKFKEIIIKISDNNFVAQNIQVLGRSIPFQKVYKRILVTDYNELFIRELSYIDYVNICQNFNIIIVENINTIDANDTNTAVRFINFIDNAYFYKVLLFMSLEDNPNKIYQGLARADEFKRTISRLNEMNSEAYLLNNNLRHSLSEIN
ncbi:cell division protein ZapE [Rickettsia typhi]|uniref:ATPase n=2 Tax=Rickettsia typhi TaxID=785 RepID=A0ABN4ACE5_RICTP|nr:cell division protein ZapE [Rickettsia typhi]AAU03685.1 probable ATPase [Rickettsia typhi str. Wilmington]AFE54062.1 ATPase [Rickettsia typhi str. TH1527]AFE54901.1 ATPase [Rickettsia typhi str. B9991CWPP]